MLFVVSSSRLLDRIFRRCVFAKEHPQNRPPQSPHYWSANLLENRCTHTHQRAYNRGGIGVTQMEITLVQPVEGGHGFVLYDDERKPCVEFGYASYEDAEVGREKLLEALKNVVTVKGLD